MNHRFILFFLLSVLGISTGWSQTAPKGFNESPFQPVKNVQIIAFIQQESFMGVQKVWWCAKNLGNDKLEISFTKVVNTTCGKALRGKADTYLKPGTTVCGSSFSGELTFETQVWEEDCKGRNKIRSITYENLVIKNMTEEEKKAEEKKAAEEAKRTARNTPPPAPTTGNRSTTSPNNATSTTNRSGSSGSGQSTYGTVNNQQQQYQAQQQQYARQQQEEAKRRQEANRIAMEQNEARMRELSAQSKRRAENADMILDGIGSVFQTIRGNQEKKDIQANNAKRRTKFAKMEEELKTGSYELVDCQDCGGVGDKSCSSCRSTGKIKCTSCQGKSGQTCTVCRGSGVWGSGSMQLSCTSCFGKGTKQCAYCGNSGEDICSPCDATGRRFCSFCEGTGKKTKYLSTPSYSNNTVSSGTYPSGNRNVIMEEPQAAAPEPPKIDPAEAAFRRKWQKDSLILKPFEKMDYRSLTDIKTDSAYAICYERDYEIGERSPVVLKTYILYRNPDGFFPFTEDLELERESYVEQEGVYRFIGFIAEPSIYLKNLAQIEEQAKKQGLPVKKPSKINKINNYSRKKMSTEDFWREVSL